MIQLALLAIVIILISSFFFLKNRTGQENSQNASAPPGPAGLPFVGSILSLSYDFFGTLEAWKQKYGDVVLCRIGSMPVIFLLSGEAIKEAYHKQGLVFSGRPAMHTIAWNSMEGIPSDEGFWRAGVAMNYGHSWVEQRRYALRSLRDFGFGKSSLAGKIQEGIKTLVKEIKKNKDMQEGRAFNVSPLVALSINNVISKITLGESYDYNDKEYLNFLSLMAVVPKYSNILFFLKAFPMCIYVPQVRKMVKKLLRTMVQLHGFFNKSIDDHRERFDNITTEPQDFTDAYLQQIRDIEDGTQETLLKTNNLPAESNLETKENNVANYSKQLVRVLADLFIAGTDTTHATVVWTIFYMAYYPDIQAKIQEEMEAVVGEGVCPTMGDQSKLVYADACCQEVLRKCSISPMGIPHVAVEDTLLNGYFIPQGTTVLANIHGVLHDPKCWTDPNLFNPERFITDDGKVKKRDNFFPFSTGKRVCLGESLARMEIYLYLVTLLHHFTFKFPERCYEHFPRNMPSEKGMMVAVHEPPVYDVIIRSRR